MITNAVLTKLASPNSAMRSVGGRDLSDLAREKECCSGLRGYGLAWHRYAAHGGAYPRRSRRQRENNQ